MDNKHRGKEAKNRGGKFTWKGLVACMLALAMVSCLIPTQTLAEAIEEAGEVVAVEVQGKDGTAMNGSSEEGSAINGTDVAVEADLPEETPIDEEPVEEPAPIPDEEVLPEETVEAVEEDVAIEEAQADEEKEPSKKEGTEAEGAGDEDALGTQSAVASNPRVVADSSMASGQVTTWDCVWFGSYPQAEITSSDSVYNSLTKASYDSNGDTTVGGTKYRRISKGDATYSGYWSNDGYRPATYRYFRYEPIKWRVLEVVGSRALVVSDVALDDQCYNTNETGVTWETCSVRSWLNGYGASSNQPGTSYTSKNFRDSAFSSANLAAIHDTTVANDDNIHYGTEGGSDTRDKVFLLSESEVYSKGGTKHGFVNLYDITDEARRCQASDYAFAMGASRSTQSEYAGSCNWLLRSPGSSQVDAAYVDLYGFALRYGHSVSVSNDVAVRPALNLDLTSSAVSPAGTVSSNDNVNETPSSPTTKSISTCTVSLSKSSYTYDGKQKSPTVTVKDGSTTLVAGTDYELSSPSGRTNAGTYTYAVTGKGNYTGTNTATLTIGKAAPTLRFANASVGKKATDPAFTNALTKATDGTVTFRSSKTGVATVDAGTGRVTIRGAGKATITASAAAGANYEAGSASYALTVTTNAVTYTVSYDANGGTGTPSAQTKAQGAALALSSARPAKSYVIRYNSAGGSVSPASKSVGCAFGGWNTRRDGSGTAYAAGATYAADADATLYAQWSNPKAGALATPARSGYAFAGWYTSASGGTRVTSSTTITSSRTVYARWTDLYDLGDETYSFENYGDYDSPFGHCFGMSITSAGYHTGLLDIGRIGGGAGTPLYGFDSTAAVRRPICHYQAIQGTYSSRAIVAGGSSYLKGTYDISSDWREVLDYVKGHSYDGTGLLQIGFRKGGYGHAINFLRYERVGGQDRVYAYDNNFPDRETYFYMDPKGNVRQAPVQTFSGAIDCIALRDVRTYFASAGDFDASRALYMAEDAASVQGYTGSYMETGAGDAYVMYEIPADQTKVTIIPKRDNADFVYMDTEYSFGEVTTDTRGELRFDTMGEGAVGSDAVFTVYEAGESIPRVTLSESSFVYDGSSHRPTVTVKAGGILLRRSVDYDVEYPTDGVAAGAHEVVVTLKGEYSGKVTKSFSVAKAANTMSARAIKARVSATYKPNSATTLARDVTFSSAKGKVTYANASPSNYGASRFAVNRATGKVTIPKATKAATYTIKVRATAAGDANHRAKSVTVTYKIVVAKAANPMAAKAVARTASLATLRSKAVTVARPITLTTKQVGTLSYAKVATGSSSYLTVNKSTGKVTVRKGAKKGIHTIKVKVTASGGTNYKAKSQVVTCKITVK